MAVNRFGDKIREAPVPPDPLEPIRDLLQRLIDALEAVEVAPQVQVSAADVHVDLSPVVAAVQAIVDRIVELPAPQVTVEAPQGVPSVSAQEIAAALAPFFQARPEWVDVLTEAMGRIQSPKIIGGSQTRKVEVMSRSEGEAVNPATSERQDTAKTVLDAIQAAVEGTLSVSGTVTATGGLTDAELRAAAVGVSGPLTDAQLRASAVPVDGSGVTQPVSAAALPLPAGAATAANQATGNGHLSTLAGTVTGGKQQVDVASSALPAGAATETTLAAIKAKTDLLPDVRTRAEDAAYLYHDAGGVTSVAAATWVTLASVTVPTGKTLRLMMAEGDLANLSSLANSRAVRVRQAGTVKAVALTGGDQPNPDIEGLTLTNSSGSDETWDVQGRHGAVTSQDMAGWFTWVDCSD